MARFSAGTQTGAGSTTLPIASLFSGPTLNLHVVEVGVFNTTTTAVDMGLYRFASGPGTVGAAITKGPMDQPLGVSAALAYTTHTAGAPTLTPLVRAELGAAIGAGMVWTFGGYGIELTAAGGTVNGLVLMPPIGTGQVCDVYFVWDE